MGNMGKMEVYNSCPKLKGAHTQKNLYEGVFDRTSSCHTSFRLSYIETLLKDAATWEAENAPSGDRGHPLGDEALRGFILRRSVARISVARTRSITRRIIGATVKHSRAIGAPEQDNPSPPTPSSQTLQQTKSPPTFSKSVM